MVTMASSCETLIICVAYHFHACPQNVPIGCACTGDLTATWLYTYVAVSSIRVRLKIIRNARIIFFFLVNMSRAWFINYGLPSNAPVAIHRPSTGEKAVGANSVKCGTELAGPKRRERWANLSMCVLYDRRPSTDRESDAL